MNTDKTENLLDHLTERLNANGWRVISNPVRRPGPEMEELKTSFQTMQWWRIPGKRKVDEPEPPKAA